MDPLHVVVAANERYMYGALVTLAGVAAGAKTETCIHFHVVTEGVNPSTFEFLSGQLTRIHPNSKIEQHVCDEKMLAGLPYWGGGADICREELLSSHYA